MMMLGSRAVRRHMIKLLRGIPGVHFILKKLAKIRGRNVAASAAEKRSLKSSFSSSATKVGLKDAEAASASFKPTPSF